MRANFILEENNVIIIVEEHVVPTHDYYQAITLVEKNTIIFTGVPIFKNNIETFPHNLLTSTGLSLGFEITSFIYLPLYRRIDNNESLSLLLHVLPSISGMANLASISQFVVHKPNC